MGVRLKLQENILDYIPYQIAYIIKTLDSSLLMFPNLTLPFNPNLAESHTTDRVLNRAFLIKRNSLYNPRVIRKNSQIFHVSDCGD